MAHMNTEACLCHSGHGENDEEGMVEFVARFNVQGKAQRLHESSRFVRENGPWYYAAGTI